MSWGVGTNARESGACVWQHVANNDNLRLAICDKLRQILGKAVPASGNMRQMLGSRACVWQYATIQQGLLGLRRELPATILDFRIFRLFPDFFGNLARLAK